MIWRKKIDYLESKAELPDILLLTKIFSDSESICNIRKKDDPNWSRMQERDKISVFKTEMEANNQSDSKLAFEDIQPPSKVTPFLKVTFLSSNERWNFTRAMNTTKSTHNYITSVMEPREVQGWLPKHKRTTRELILEHLTA